MNRPGPGQQPLRGLGGFPGQPAPHSRSNPLGAGRMQASKLGNWGFGSGVPAPQSRTAVSGSSQSLDPTEFPGLPGGNQTQYQNPGQAVWASANQRTNLHNPVQRPQQAPSNPLQSQQYPQGHDQGQSIDDGLFPSFNSTLDDFRNGGQGGVGQLSSAGQSQSTTIDEFPPLGRNAHGEIGQDRRGNLMQNAAPGMFSSTYGPQANQMHTRQGDTFQPSNVTRIMSPPAGGLSAMRSPTEATRSTYNGILENDKNGKSEGGLSSTADDQMKSDSSADPHNPQGPSHGQAQSVRTQNYGAAFSGDARNSPTGTNSREKTPLSQMSAQDRYGLAGLLETVRNNPDGENLAIGHDLTTLGLELNSPEPLWPTWAGPFAGFPTRPLQPRFTLPACYRVHNTHKEEEKASSFSDETLFYIFYTRTKDVMQEVAAIELTHRNWRYHKEHQVWLTKDPQFGEPQPISHEAERGRYVVFNQKSWQRESRDMVLRWADLDDHIQVRPTPLGMN